jgi:hypothetical protein
VHDGAALDLVVRIPTNVSAFELASWFFTHEYPEFICSPFNDVFTILQERDGVLENIVFDAAGNPITVNNALLAACIPGTHGGIEFRCPLGYRPLVGTGYDVGCEGPRTTPEDSGASTGCIQTTSRVRPGEVITLRVAIWDSGDPYLDSLALVDGFAWIPDPFTRVAP